MSNPTMPNPPIACDFRALDAGQRARQEQLYNQVHAAVEEVSELADGYALRLPADATMVLTVAEFAALERQCCPFFAFGLDLEAREQGPGALWLRVTGREGVKEYARAELGIA